MFTEEEKGRITSKAVALGINPMLGLSLVGTFAKQQLGLIKAEDLHLAGINDYAMMLADLVKKNDKITTREISEEDYKALADNPAVGAIAAHTSGTEPITNKDLRSSVIALKDYAEASELHGYFLPIFHESFKDEIEQVILKIKRHLKF